MYIVKWGTVEYNGYYRYDFYSCSKDEQECQWYETIEMLKECGYEFSDGGYLEHDCISGMIVSI